jgi:hypothetical protein
MTFHFVPRNTNSRNRRTMWLSNPPSMYVMNHEQIIFYSVMPFYLHDDIGTDRGSPRVAKHRSDFR